MNNGQDEEAKTDQMVDKIILVYFDEAGEATTTLRGVTVQQILTAAALLDAMARHMLDVRFTQEERRAVQQQAENQMLINKIARDVTKT